MADAAAPFDHPHASPPMPPPADWAQRFAALPQEAPPPAVWDAICARVKPVTPRRRRPWPLGFALAACMAALAAALALWLPMLVDEDVAEDLDTAAVAVTERSVGVTHSEAGARRLPPPLAMASPAASDPANASDRPDPSMPQPVSQPQPQSQPSPERLARADRMPLPGSARGQRPRRSTVPRRSAADPLELPLQQRTAALLPGAHGAHIAESGAGPLGVGRDESVSLPDLQTRSAQLESLLASIRDPSVGTGPAALLAAEHDSRLATIDAALTDTPVDDADAQRTLWQARVGALQGALSFESALRTLAAEGREYDGALVGVD